MTVLGSFDLQASWDYGYHLRIGARTFVNVGLVALDVAPVTTPVDPRVRVITPTHPVQCEMNPAGARSEAAKWMARISEVALRRPVPLHETIPQGPRRAVR
jgi:hypothetical protein